MNTETDEGSVPVACQVQRHVRPAAWVGADALQFLASATGRGYTMTSLKNAPDDGDAPLYDQAALDAAVAEANRRQNAAWALMAEKLVAAERERCAKKAAPEHIQFSDDEWRVRCEVRDSILGA